jgi:hypothetical protein
MAEPPKPTQPIRMKVSANLHEYLSYLARTTTMGRDENDVALSVLTQQLEVLRRSPEYAYRFSDEPKKDS